MWDKYSRPRTRLLSLGHLLQFSAMAGAAAAAAAPATYPAAQTRLNIPGAAPAGARDDDVYEINRSGPLARHAAFADLRRPAAPALFQIPRYQINAAVALACTFDLEDDATVAMLRASTIVRHELRHTDASGLLHLSANPSKRLKAA